MLPRCLKKISAVGKAVQGSGSDETTGVEDERVTKGMPTATTENEEESKEIAMAVK